MASSVRSTEKVEAEMVPRVKMPEIGEGVARVQRSADSRETRLACAP
jgi:hypothetical protein